MHSYMERPMATPIVVNNQDPVLLGNMLEQTSGEKRDIIRNQRDAIKSIVGSLALSEGLIMGIATMGPAERLFLAEAREASEGSLL